MERKFERKEKDQPLTKIGNTQKPKDFDLEKTTLNKKDKVKNN